MIYIHTDHLGTPRFGTNTAGTQVWIWTSDAFGVGAPSGSRTVNLRMAGQYYDSESGLFYNWNRYYNPNIGRYVSVDPIGLGGGLNTFNYVEASPVMYTDPTGQALVIPIGYVLWGTAIITTTACNAIPACKQYIIDSAVNMSNGIREGVQWCINQATSSEEEEESAEEREKRCAENLDRDLETCIAVSKRRGAKYYGVCKLQAMTRYSNCLSGRDEEIDAPLPPWRL